MWAVSELIFHTFSHKSGRRESEENRGSQKTQTGSSREKYVLVWCLILFRRENGCKFASPKKGEKTFLFKPKHGDLYHFFASVKCTAWHLSPFANFMFHPIVYIKYIILKKLRPNFFQPQKTSQRSKTPRKVERNPLPWSRKKSRKMSAEPLKRIMMLSES